METGLINQHINPIKTVNKYIIRIKEEKTIICSLRIKNGLKKKIKAASRVPIPKIEIGIKLIKLSIVKITERSRKGTLLIPTLLAIINI